VAHFDDPALRFSERLEIVWRIAPTALAYVVLATLDQIAGPWLAAKLYLAGWLLGLVTAERSLLRAVDAPWPDVQALAVLPFAFAWYTYMGFLPFIGTFPLFAWTLAVFLGAPRGAGRTIGLVVLQLAVFGFHVVGAAAAALGISVLAGLAWLRGDSSLPEAAGDAATSAPVALATLLFVGGANGPDVQRTADAWTDRVRAMIGFTTGALDDAASPFLVAGVIGVAAGIVLALLRTRQLPRLAVLAAILVGLGLLIPISFGSLWPAGPRLFPFALLAAIGAVRPTRPMPYFACVALIVAPAACTVWRASEPLDRQYAAYEEAARFLTPGSTFLPVVADPREGSRRIDPFWSIASVLTIRTGAIHPYLFAAPYVRTGASPLRYRWQPRIAIPYDPLGSPESYRGTSAEYEHVVLWGPLPAIAAVLGEDYEVVFDEPPLMVLRRRGDHASPPRAPP